MRLRPRLVAASFVVLATSACARAPKPAAVPTPPAIDTPRALVARMRDTWGQRFYRTMTFRQKNTLYRQDGGADASEWMEYQQVPRRLRVEFLPAGPKSGMLFRENKQFTFADGKLAGERQLVHALLLLSADVYALPVDTTMADIAALRMDTTRLSRATWEGRPAWVVGAEAGDTTTSQFWVDAERLLLVRVIQRSTNAQGRTTVSENHLTYQDVDSIPVPKVITFLRDGRPYWKEEYVEVRLNVPLDEALFDPTKWSERFGATGGP
jgi:hypothetical protein